MNIYPLILACLEGFMYHTILQKIIEMSRHLRINTAICTAHAHNHALSMEKVE